MDTRKKIESFQFVRMYYQTLGINSPEEKTYFSLNKNVFVFLVKNTILFILTFAYCLFEAESIGDRVYSYVLSITILWHVILVLVYFLKIPNTLEFIEKIDEFICKSKVEFLFFNVSERDKLLNICFIL